LAINLAETILINKSLSEEEIYKSLLPQIENIINPKDPLISNLANISAALKEAFDKISWVGFYLLIKDKLYLGPFQGKIACTSIEIGKGVCGTAALQKETIIVENVDDFPGHIACDSGSRSEIVVPLISGNSLFGVLDLDSYQLSAFETIDKKYLEQICNIITNKFSFEKSIL
jgi:L-methionine (R)-S-oxide reductase